MLDIQQPGRGKLDELQPRCDWVVAWGLYALAQPGLSENKAGYVYRRLIGQDPPPQDALLLAGLSPPEWRALYRAQRYRDDSQIDASLHDRLAAWHTLLGSIWERLTFDLGAGEEATREAEPAEQLLASTARESRRWSSPQAEVRETDSRVPPSAAEDRLMVDGAAATPEPVAVLAALPAAVLALLDGEEDVSHTEDGYEIAVRDLYHAYELARVLQSEGIEEAVEVIYCARDRHEYMLNAEVLALALEPFPSDVWRTVEIELPLRLSGPEQKIKWRGVEPLGIGAMAGPGAVPGVVLCVPDEGQCAWLEAFHTSFAAATIGDILGQQVDVSFSAHRPAVPAPSPLSPL